MAVCGESINVPDFVFAQQVFGIGKKGDVLLAISTSGNSKNILLIENTP